MPCDTGLGKYVRGEKEGTLSVSLMAKVGDGRRRRYERLRTVIALRLSCSDFRVDVAFRHNRLGRQPPVVLSSGTAADAAFGCQANIQRATASLRARMQKVKL